MSEKLQISTETPTRNRGMAFDHAPNGFGAVFFGPRKNSRNIAAKTQKLVAGILAVIGINRVYAVAKELEVEDVDPLANIRRVDDLSGIGELCIPALTNVSVEEERHDHEISSRQYASVNHHGHGSNHDDSYASRYANKYARDHDSHNDHEDRAHDDHARVEKHHDHRSASSHQNHSSHRGHTDHSGHTSHQFNNADSHDNHAINMSHKYGSHIDMSTDHKTHSNIGNDHSNHLNHMAHGVSAHQHKVPNGGSLSKQSDGAPDEGHDHTTGHQDKIAVADQGGIVENGGEMPYSDHQEVTKTADVALEELTQVLQEIPLEEEAAAQSHNEHHAHGPTLVMMDLPPAEDLTGLTVPVL